MLTGCAARELTYFVGLEWDDDDQAILGRLVDAALVWAEDEILAEIAAPIVEELWARDLREDIERALEGAALLHPQVRRVLADAKDDLAAGHSASLLARAIVEPAEIRAAVAAASAGGPDVAVALATDERRRSVREWLGRLAELGRCSIPKVAEELEAAVRAPRPEPADDPIWREAVLGITAQLAPEWN